MDTCLLRAKASGQPYGHRLYGVANGVGRAGSGPTAIPARLSTGKHWRNVDGWNSSQASWNGEGIVVPRGRVQGGATYTAIHQRTQASLSTGTGGVRHVLCLHRHGAWWQRYPQSCLAPLAVWGRKYQITYQVQNWGAVFRREYKTSHMMTESRKRRWAKACRGAT